MHSCMILQGVDSRVKGGVDPVSDALASRLTGPDFLGIAFLDLTSKTTYP